MKHHLYPVLLSVAAAAMVFASGPHTGGVYTVQPAALDGGGGRSSSANYAHESSLLDIAGTSTGGVYATAHGYTAQSESTVVPPACPEFTAWQTTHFGSSAAPNAAPGLDPDNDGVVNLAEFAFNMSPLAANAAPLPPGGSSGVPRYTVETVQGQQRLTVEFIARTGCLAYQLESTNNLTGWNNVSPVELSPPVSLGNGLERRKWADTQPLVTGPERFLRIRISL